MRSCLAPMDGITDLAYRTICKEICIQHSNPEDELMLRTEFMSADGYIINPPGVIKHLRKSDFEPELIAQIFWDSTEMLLQCALDIERKYEFAGIEINMGCPSPSVMKCDAGSAMLKDKPKTLGTLKQISERLTLPLSLKTRIGMTQHDKDEQFAFLLEASKYVRMIIIHGRTYSQSHAGEVDREFIYRLKGALPEKIIIWNGGIRSYADAHSHVLPSWERGAEGDLPLDGIMIAQSAIWNPRILTPHQPALEERFATINRHLRLMMASERLFDQALQCFDEKITMPTYEQLNEVADKIEQHLDRSYRTPMEFRKYLFNYLTGLPGNKDIKKQIATRKIFPELWEGLLRYEDSLISLGNCDKQSNP